MIIIRKEKNVLFSVVNESSSLVLLIQELFTCLFFLSYCICNYLIEYYPLDCTNSNLKHKLLTKNKNSNLDRTAASL